MKTLLIILTVLVYSVMDARFHQVTWTSYTARPNYNGIWHKWGARYRFAMFICFSAMLYPNWLLMLWSGYTIALFHEILFPFRLKTTQICQGDWDTDCFLVWLRDKYGIHLHIYTTTLYILFTGYLIWFA